MNPARLVSGFDGSLKLEFHGSKAAVGGGGPRASGPKGSPGAAKDQFRPRWQLGPTTSG